MLCRVVKGSVRWKGKNRKVGEIVDISKSDFIRLGYLLERYEEPSPEPVQEIIPESAPAEEKPVQAESKKISARKKKK